MDSIAQVLTLGGVILAFVGILAVSFAHYRTKNTETVIENLRGDRDDLQARVGRLEEDNQRINREKEALADDNKKLHAEMALLKDMITSRQVINDLVTAVKEHDKRVDERVNDIMTTMTTMSSSLISLQGAILMGHHSNKVIEGKVQDEDSSGSNAQS